MHVASPNDSTLKLWLAGTGESAALLDAQAPSLQFVNPRLLLHLHLQARLALLCFPTTTLAL